MPVPVPVTKPRLLGFFSQEAQDGRGISHRENVVPVPVAKVGFLGFLKLKVFPALRAAGKRLSKNPSFLRVPCPIWLAAGSRHELHQGLTFLEALLYYPINNGVNT